MSVAFLLFLALGLIAHLLTPDLTFSDTEKRALETFTKPNPQNVASGRFMSSFDRYASDQFPYRQFLVGLKSESERALGKFDNGRVWFGKDGFLVEKKTETPDLSLHKNALLSFGEALAAHYPELNRYLMIAPTASEMLPERLPPFAPTIPQRSILDNVYAEIGDYHVIDLSERLRQGESDTYFYRNDHHWTSVGAKIAYEAFAEASHLTPTENLKETLLSDSFLGTTYAKAALFNPLPDKITIFEASIGEDINDTLEIFDDTGTLLRRGVYALDKLQTSDPYLVFLGENRGYLKLTSKVKNGDALLLIKDSYANAVVPFLSRHYETIHLIDLRYFRGDLLSLIEEEGPIKDTLILYNFVTFSEDRNLYRLLG